MKQQYPLDRSCAFTALLELSPLFRHTDPQTENQMMAEFLRDWYADEDSRDMFAFAREWVTLPLSAECSFGRPWEYGPDWHRT